MPKIVLYEQGTSGLKEWSGFIDQAYNRSLKWPSVQPLYSRLRRSDPEVSAVRQIFTSLIRGATIRWEGPNEPTDGDKQALEFCESLGEDIVGGWDDFMETLISYVPFMGWGWWEVVPGIRRAGWSPPDDEWQSSFTDGRIGIRKLAFRDSSSFYSWQFDDNGRRLIGMNQSNYPHPTVMLPLDNSLHITFGDPNNPEGLSPLEAVWRLERIKYGLEVIQGIGFEHAAGYLSVTAENNLSPSDNIAVEKAARAVLSAQEGNYAAWPKGVTGEVKDIPFAAAPSLLEAIRYFGILKLVVFNAQSMAMSTLSGAGSYAALNDSSSTFILSFNAMLDGFSKQFDEQVGKRLFKWNSFPGMTKRPHFSITPVNKITLQELGDILAPLQAILKMGDDDQIAIRKASGFLPETLPESISDTSPAERSPEQQAEIVAQASRKLLHDPEFMARLFNARQ